MMPEFLKMLEPQADMARYVSETVLRLIFAAFLGGIIGLERELKGKPAGLRTNMFICFGAAMFTILSHRLAGDAAAQIIPGIGFIGAGSILHSRGGVQGLTTAATLFVVASVGMAVGGGLLLMASFATLMILLALHLLGYMERRLHLKAMAMSYEVVGPNPEVIIGAINRVLQDLGGKTMNAVNIRSADGQYRVDFSLEVTNEEHREVLASFRQADALKAVVQLNAREHE
jgi:putative Mg2+ transporter-C (MgtC) family protein